MARKKQTRKKISKKNSAQKKSKKKNTGKRAVKKQTTKKESTRKTTKKKNTPKKTTKKKNTSKQTKPPSKTKLITRKQNEKEETTLHYDRRWCAALTYLLVGIIWFFSDKKMKENKFVKFHTKQALTLLLTVIALQVLANIVPVLAPLWFIVGMFLLILGLIGVVHALEHKEKNIPILGKYAKNFLF